MVSDDGDIDKLVFNVHASDTDWVQYDSSGNRTGTPTTFSFNKISNYGAVDTIGIYYGGTVTTSGAFQELTSASTASAHRLRDGVIYEDSFSSDNGLTLTSANAKDVSVIRANIANIIQTGGTANASSPGSSDLDFTYILYAQSSDNASQVSAYIYSGTYGLQNKAAGSTFDNTELKIVGIAEVQNIANGVMNDNFQTSKPADLS